MTEHVVIDARFNGPPQAANGGYACGVVASLVGGDTVEATLRRPLHLDAPLEVVRSDEGLVQLLDEGELGAEGMIVGVDLAAPPAMGLAAAVTASADYRGFLPGGTFPYCFVCGPAREDGLRIFAGPVPGSDLVAAPWTPQESVTGPDGTVPPEIVWAALDCPTFFAATEPDTVALLGRMTARRFAEVRGGEPHVVVARGEGRDGRKRFGTSALYTEAGALCAVALETWITIGTGGFPSP